MKPFYVYELIDPRDGKPFYVGKGKGNRVDRHEKDAKAGACLGRFDTIKDIWADGLEVEKRVVARFEREADAFKAESARIAKIGPENLTNWTSGAGFDPEFSYDRGWGKALWVIGVKTDGFSQVRHWLYGEKWHRIPACALIVFKNQWDSLILKRGAQWMRKHCAAIVSNAL